jgi:aryl-alcohol dehydrogenase-like predicted oxidoreductase
MKRNPKPDMPKPKKIQSVDDRLAAAQKKLTPAQIKKIKAIVAETRRRAGA